MKLLIIVTIILKCAISSTFGGYFHQTFPAARTYYNSPNLIVSPQQPISAGYLIQTPTSSNYFISHQNIAPPAQHFYTQSSPNHYQGFAYHTEYNDGGSSHVVFYTGSNAKQLLQQTFQIVPQQPIFPFTVRNITADKKKQDELVSNARTVASSMIDPVTTTPKPFSSPERTEKPMQSLPKDIQSIYTTLGVRFADNPSLETFRSTIDTPFTFPPQFYSNVPVQHFYTVPTIPLFPASTAPLVRGYSLKKDDKNNTSSDDTVTIEAADDTAQASNVRNTIVEPDKTIQSKNSDANDTTTESSTESSATLSQQESTDSSSTENITTEFMVGDEENTTGVTEMTESTTESA